MGKSGLYTVFALLLVLSFGLVLAQDNFTNNETHNNETSNETQDNSTNNETQDNETNNETNDETHNDETNDETHNNETSNETDNETHNNETNNETHNNETNDETNNDETKTNTKVEYKEKRGLGQVINGKVRAGIYTSESGETFRVRDLAQNRIALLFGEEGSETEVETKLEIEEETENGTTKLKVKMKNGNVKEIKIMPNIASQKILERLGIKVCSEENNCTIELKEVGKSENNESKLAYEIQIERHSKILGIFKSKMRIQAIVSAEDGEILRINKPWWAFLATEPREE